MGNLKSKTKKFFVVFTLLMYLTSLMSSAFVVNAETSSATALARYFNSTTRSKWEVNNPYPLEDYSVTGNNNNILNDGSTEYPSEAYLAMNDIAEGVVTASFDFILDRGMDDASFKFLSGKDTVWGIAVKDGGLYLEGDNTQIASCEQNVTYYVKAVFDMDSNTVDTVWLNGKTVAEDKAFVASNAPVDGFSIRTGIGATGVITNKNFNADKGYIVKEDFTTSGGAFPDDWSFVGDASLRKKNSVWYDKYDLLLNGASREAKIEKSFEAVSGNLKFNISVLQPEKGGSYTIQLSGNNTTAVEITSDGTDYYSNSNEGGKTFAEYAKNVYNLISVDANTVSKTANVYFNGVKVRTGIPFDGQAECIDKITVKAESGCLPVYVDDIELSYIGEYAEDYPEIGTVPNKIDGTPLVSMQVCPMWTEGQHFGWDYINHSSNMRKPVLGFYDDTSAEQVDWTIKYMKEHGVDFMNIAMFPYLPSDSTSIVAQPTATATRNTGFINSYINSRYSDQINFAIFLEATGLADYGTDFYDDFFEVILPQYIELYFKHPQYQKIDGRPVFGIHATTTFLDMLDHKTGNVLADLTKDSRIRQNIQKIRNMCIEAGVGDPYLVGYGHNRAEKIAKAGMDAATVYGYNDRSVNFTVQRYNMEAGKELCADNNIDFIPAAFPIRNDAAWRISQGFMHTGEEFERHLEWINTNLLSGYNPPKNSSDTKLINIGTWDEYGEGHVMMPTEGNGFMYLDAIRNVMTDGTTHTDTVPTQAQKARIGNLYRIGKKAPNIVFEGETANKQVYYKTVERDITTPIPTTALKTWSFKGASEDSELITSVSGGTYTVTADGICVTPDSTTIEENGVATPSIVLSGIDNIDIGKVTYVKVRMKKNPTADGATVFWTSNFYDEHGLGRSIYMNTSSGDGTDFVDYYAPVYENSGWTGKLTSLKFALGPVTSTDTITVESVELLEELSFENKYKFKSSLQTVYLDEAFVEKNGVKTFPLSLISNLAGADYLSCYGSEDRYIIKYGGIIADFTLGSASALINGKTLNLECPAYKLNDELGETVYAPISLLKEIFYDCKISYDNETKTLLFEDDAPSTEELLLKINGDAFDRYGHIDVSYDSYGRITGKSSSTDAQCFKSGISVTADESTFIEVRCYFGKATNGEIFYITDTDSTWNGSKRFPISFKAGYNVLKIDTSNASNWTGTITGIRLDPTMENGVGFSVSSLSFAKEYKEPVIEVPKLNPFKPAYVLNTENKISVYGKADEEFAGKQVSVILLDDDAELSEITADDLLYINQFGIEADGRYSCSFNIDETVKPEECKLYVRVGTRDITYSVTRAVMSTYDVLDCSASVTINDGTATGIVKTEELYGFDSEECEYIPVMAFYNSDKRLISVEIGQSNIKQIALPIPTDTKTVSFFVWSNLETLIPLCRGDEASIN